MRHPPRPQLPPPPRRAKETGQPILRPVWRDLPSLAGRGRVWRGREGANRLWDRDDGQLVGPMGREREKSGLGLLHFLSPTGWGGFDGWVWNWEPHPSPWVVAGWAGVSTSPGAEGQPVASGFHKRAVGLATCPAGPRGSWLRTPGRALSWGTRGGNFPPRKGKKPGRRKVL